MNRSTNGKKVLANANSASHFDPKIKNLSDPQPSSSGIQSFLRWFKKNERARKYRAGIKSSVYPHDITSSSSSENIHGPQDQEINDIEIRNQKYDSSETLSAPSSPNLDYRSQSSSCDSVFSTATTGFAFVPPNHYRPYGKGSQPEKLITSGPDTDTYRRRLRQRDRSRDLDQQLELTLKKKYGLFGTTETLKSQGTILEDDSTAGAVCSLNSSSNNTTDNQFVYYDLSLPNVRRPSEENDLANNLEENSASGNIQNNNKNNFKKKHRRTVSDSSKDKKSGAYVHVKGKRKAPPPPSNNNKSQTNSDTLTIPTNSITPNSTLGRKKRKAPQPPFSPSSFQASPFLRNDLTDDLIFSEGLLDDKEIKAIIEGTSYRNTNPEMDHIRTENPSTSATAALKVDEVPSKNLTEQQKQILIDNIVKMQDFSCYNISSSSEPSSMPTSPKIFSNDTLKLERGVLMSNRPNYVSPYAKQQELKVADGKSILAPSSPISPRPWYKRPLSTNRETSIPFKKEVLLRTVDKRKSKQPKENENSDVRYSRNSSLFDGSHKFGLFAKLENSKRKDKDADKRRSGIGIPNISELDREAAEIVHKEHAVEQARLEAEKEKQLNASAEQLILKPQMFFGTKDEEYEDDLFDASPRKSTKELISKFEASSNMTRVSVNTSFIGRRENFFDNNRKDSRVTDQTINTQRPNSSTSTSTSAPEARITVITTTVTKTSTPPSSRSIFSNIGFKNPPQTMMMTKQNDSDKNSDDRLLQKDYQNKNNTTTSTTTATSTDSNVKPEVLKQNNKITKSEQNILGIWTCPYCTLENPNWRILCEVCERIKPYDKRVTNVSDKFDLAVPATENVTDRSTCTPDTLAKNFPVPGKLNVAGLNISDKPYQQTNEWEKKTERVLKYFMPRLNGNTLSKSVSETSIGGGSKGRLVKKSPSPSKLLGSPKLGLKNVFQRISPEKPTGPSPTDSTLSKDKLNDIPEGRVENDKRTDIIKSSLVITTVTPIFQDPGIQNEKTFTSTKVKDGTPDMDEVRLARLHKFTNSESDHHNEISSSLSLTTIAETKREMENNRSVKNETPPLSDRNSLEKEKQRLREMIRAMNAKALADKYPVIQKSLSFDETTSDVMLEPMLEKKLQPPNNPPIDSTKFSGAIKKLFTRKTEIVDDNLSDKATTEKDSNKNDTTVKPSKVSTSVQTPGVVKKSSEDSRKYEDPPLWPITEIIEKENPYQLITHQDFVENQITKLSKQVPVDHIYANIFEYSHNYDPSVMKQVNREENFYVNHVKLSEQDKVKVDELAEQLKSVKGREEFKATLKFSPKAGMESTSTLAINKIMRTLEMAIMEGQHELAAQLAKDLAKMKVSLSVTRQKSRPLSATDVIDLKTIIVDMYVEDNVSHKGPIELSLSPLMTILELKQKIAKDFEMPIDIQRWILNDQLATDDKRTLLDFGVKDNKSIIYLYLVAPIRTVANDKIHPKEEIQINKKLGINEASGSSDIKKYTPAEEVQGNFCDSDEDISDNQNEKVGINDDTEIGAIALPVPSENIYGTLKVGWACPLCTLINSPNRPGCVACSEARPTNYIIPREFRVPEDDFVIPDELKKFLEDEKIPNVDNEKNFNLVTTKRPLEKKNDLSKVNPSNRKSSDILNIMQDEETKKATTSQSKNVSNNQIINNIPADLNFPPQTSIIMTAITSGNPNITKNKYRGVDNFNPNMHGYVTPKIVDAIVKSSTSQIPIKTKSTQLQNINKTEASSVANQQKTKSGSTSRPEKRQAPQPPAIVAGTPKNNLHFELINLDNADAVPNTEPFECPVCFMKYGQTEGVILRDCLHTFCRECLANTIQYSEEAEVRCPYMDADYSCDSVLQEREIKSLVSRENYEQHLAKSVRQAEHKIENAFHCKTPNCRGWCIFEDNVNQFKCPVCKITNCLTCQVIHDGLNCKQYQDRMNSDCDSNMDARRTKEMLENMVEKGEAMNCPTCQVIMMKKWGCDWLKCSMCKTEICWVTRGPRWGPGGKGDTTAGCKCGVDGKKCHPKCNYCH